MAAYTKSDAAKGNKPRTCIGPRPINRLLPKDPRSIPNVADVLRRLYGFKYISEIDLTKRFNQSPVNPADRHKLTFTWMGKKRMFCGAPFGLSPLSPIFQGSMEQILHHAADFSVVFIDNIYGFTVGDCDMAQHGAQVIDVLQTLTQSNLRVNADKCLFGYNAIVALGHVVSSDSRQPDPEKLELLRGCAVPQTGADFMAFWVFLIIFETTFLFMLKSLLPWKLYVPVVLLVHVGALLVNVHFKLSWIF